MHETTTKRPGRAGKYIRRALLALAAVILAAVLVLLALFQAELRTLNTIERVDDTDLFTMTYLGDYGLDDFLAQGGASNDNELLDFLMQKLLKGLPLRFDIPDLGATSWCEPITSGSTATCVPPTTARRRRFPASLSNSSRTRSSTPRRRTRCR